MDKNQQKKAVAAAGKTLRKIGDDYQKKAEDRKKMGSSLSGSSSMSKSSFSSGWGSSASKSSSSSKTSSGSSWGANKNKKKGW